MPSYWTNFGKYFGSICPVDTFTKETYITLNNVLKEFHVVCEMDFETKDVYLTFDSDEAMSFFILRWS